MKKLGVTLMSTLCLLTIFSLSHAQKKASPAATAEGTIGGVNVKIDYHQPSAKGRKVMGELVPYDKVWRTGANNATTIELSDDLKIEGKTLAKGKYALFTIPGEKEWVIIINKNAKQWGAYDYKEADDVLRVSVKPTKAKSFVETFKIEVLADGVNMEWENTAVKFGLSK
ncbi:MAG TPA: DUF2911 domain-containing protein [Fulvivirga sp.]|nr:DUF2911 domain-containing protein [Fulvivirga sp.]